MQRRGITTDASESQQKLIHLSIGLCSISECKKQTNSMNIVVWFTNKWLFWASQKENQKSSYLFQSYLRLHIYLVQTEEIERGKGKCYRWRVFSKGVLTGEHKAVLPFFLSLSVSSYLISVFSDHFISLWEWAKCAFCESLWVKVSKWCTWCYLSFCWDCVLYLSKTVKLWNINCEILMQFEILKYL